MISNVLQILNIFFNPESITIGVVLVISTILFLWFLIRIGIIK